jgi:hypothetical protein
MRLRSGLLDATTTAVLDDQILPAVDEGHVQAFAALD